VQLAQAINQCERNLLIRLFRYTIGHHVYADEKPRPPDIAYSLIPRGKLLQTMAHIFANRKCINLQSFITQNLKYS